MIRRIKVRGFPKFDPKKYRNGKVPSFDKLARYLLAECDQIFDSVASLDTAVRDIASDGIARLLHVAYDTQACSLGLEAEANWAFIESSTAEWFRTRGYAEWYCQGAAMLFHTSRPRTLAEINKMIVFKRSPGRKKKVQVAA